MQRVLIVGSARESRGGVSSVIKLMEKVLASPYSSGKEEYKTYWLGTQIQRNYLWKLWFALKGNIIAFFIMWRYDIVHMHTTPDKLGLIIQLPILLWAKILRKKVIIQLHVGNQLKTKKNGLFVYTLKHADLIVLLAYKWKRLFAEWYPEINVPTTVLYNAISDEKETFGTKTENKNKNEKDNENETLRYENENETFGTKTKNKNYNYNENYNHNENDNDNEYLKHKENVILMAAWFNENKAPDVLLRAIDNLNHNNNLKGWKVILMGNGEVDKYKSLSHEMGLDGIVSFPGYLTGKEKEEIWRKASLYCMCSYEEGFPMVVLEAWKYGAAVVTTPVGGLPDVIEEGKNCLTFDFGDSEGLAKQLKLLMGDENKRREMATYSKMFVQENFSLEKMGDELKKVYRLVVLSAKTRKPA